MIKIVQLFSPSECGNILDRVLAFKNNFYSEFPGSYLQCLGYPIYLTCLQQKPRSLKNTLFFNELISDNFSDVLERTIEALKKEVNGNIYLEKTISYPGFHVIKIPTGDKAPSNFHFDTEHTYLSAVHPELGIDPKAQCLSFTILMTVDPNLISGLHYVDDSTLSHELLIKASDKVAQNQSLLKRAQFHAYRPGALNLHSNIPHSLYGENSGQDELYRISFQGHLIPAKNGHLLYW